MPQVVTANRLRDGLAVFLTADREWSQDLGDAAVAKDDSAATALLRAAGNDVAAGLVVDPYAVALEDDGDPRRPRERRERIRAAGPTVRQDFNTRRHGSDA